MSYSNSFDLSLDESKVAVLSSPVLDNVVLSTIALSSNV